MENVTQIYIYACLYVVAFGIGGVLIANLLIFGIKRLLYRFPCPECKGLAIVHFDGEDISEDCEHCEGKGFVRKDPEQLTTTKN